MSNVSFLSLLSLLLSLNSTQLLWSERSVYDDKSQFGLVNNTPKWNFGSFSIHIFTNDNDNKNQRKKRWKTNQHQNHQLNISNKFFFVFVFIFFLLNGKSRRNLQVNCVRARAHTHTINYIPAIHQITNWSKSRKQIC